MTKDRISKEQFCIFMSAQENAQTITSFDSHKGTIELKDGQFVEAIQIDNSREGPDKLSVSVRDANNELKIHFGVTQLNAKDGISFTLDNEYVYAVQSDINQGLSLEEINKKTMENIRLAYHYANKHYQPANGTFEDHTQAGAIALLRAWKKMDPTKSEAEITAYQIAWLREEFDNLSRSGREVYYQKAHLRPVQAFMAVRNKLTGEDAIPPRLIEIANELNISIEAAAQLEKAAVGRYGFEYIDQPQKGQDNKFSNDPYNPTAPTPEELVIQEKFKAFLHGVIDELDEREQFIVRNYYGINCKEMTLSELGEELGISSERSRQLLKDAKEKLLIALQKYNISIEDAEPADQTPSIGFNEHDLSIKSFS